LLTIHPRHNNNPAHAADQDADADADVAFATYVLDVDNNFTWQSVAVLYLGDIAAGDWGVDGPKLQVPCFAAFL
jgi:hypothetical protein